MNVMPLPVRNVKLWHCDFTPREPAKVPNNLKQGLAIKQRQNLCPLESIYINDNEISNINKFSKLTRVQQSS